MILFSLSIFFYLFLYTFLPSLYSLCFTVYFVWYEYCNSQFLFISICIKHFSIPSLFIFNWRMTVLQCCIGFCCIETQMICVSIQQKHKSAMSIYILSLSLPPLIPVGCHRAPDWVTEQLPITCFTHGDVYMLMVLSQFISPSSSSTVSTRLSSTSLSLEMPCK